MSLKNCFLLLCLCVFASFPVIAGEKVTVVIKGVDKDAFENVMSSLSLEKQKDNPRLTESRIKTLHKKALEEIKTALQALGYYKPAITPDLNKTKAGWVASYLITPGESLKVTHLNLEITGEGATDEAFLKFKKQTPLKQGDTLHHGHYESTKKELQRLAATRGYFDAGFITSKVEVDLKAYQANVTLHFDTGSRFRFGDIQFSDSPVRLEALQNYLPFKQGDYYQNKKLIKLQQNLSNSDYFEEVQVQPLRDQITDHTVPVRVTLTPRKRNRYTAGIGFGTDTGPRLKLGWDSRYINSRGHRLSTDAKISPVLSTLSTEYTIPHFHKKDAQLGFNSALSHEDTGTSTSNSISLGSNYRHKRWGWDETISLNYLFENFEVSDEEETSKLLIPGIGWTKTKNDDPTYTRNGYRLGLNIRGAAQSFLSDTSFLQASLNGKYIRSFWNNGRIIMRGNLGLTEVTDFGLLPTSLRFFAGGDNSIRGFDYEDLGPRDANGKVIGGKYLMIGSIEYEHRIKEKWSVAGFVDAGNAFNKFGGQIEYGAGFGVRWLSPVGLVRVDLAMGVSEPDNPIRLHIVIGPDL